MTFIIINKRNSIYNFDTAQSYAYQFDSSQSILIDVDLKNGKVKLPKEINRDQSIFLKVYLKATVIGNYFEPSITITSHNNSFIQYFEIGAKGYRFINLSSLIEGGAEEIVFNENKVELEDQVAQLIIFDNPNLLNSKILVISPHPDDAEIAAYGLYSKYPKSFILTITSGEAGSFNYDELYQDTTNHYLKKGKLRTWNSVSVPLLGGISRDSVLNLGFFDSTLKNMFSLNPMKVNSLFVKNLNRNTYKNINISDLKWCIKGDSNWPSLIENIKCVLKEVNPDIIVTPYPLIDKHEDHKFSTIAIFQALKELNMKKGSLFLYTNHFMNDYFPFGKSGSIISLPPNFEDDIYFKSIYSNSLDSMLQKDKVFALESMNDLRMDTEWRFWDKLLINSGLTLNRKILGKEKDYFRRSIRSNELFFVVPIEDIYNKQKMKSLVGNSSLIKH